MNNPALYDAALVAIAASNGAWINNPAPAHYAGELSAAQAIATEIDNQIPIIATGATISQRQLLESIVKSVMIGRTPDSTSNYLEIAQAIAAVFTEYSPNLQDDDVGSYVLSVPTFAVLISLAGAVIGQKVRVESVGRTFEFAPLGTSPVQDAVVMNGIGGQWHSLDGTSDQKWLAQANWYVDAIAGNDENPGTLLLPIKSTDEIQRRWGSNPTITIRITINFINIPDIVNLSANRASDSAGLNLLGTNTEILSSTIGVFTAKNDALNQSNMITSPGVLDWTPYVGMRIQSNGNAYSWIRKVNPDGSGVNKAGVTAFYQLGTFGTLTTPVAGQALVIHQISTCSSICIVLRNGKLNDAAVGGFLPAIFMRDVAVTKQCTLNAPAGISNIKLYGCDLLDLQLLPQGAGAYSIACRQRFAQVNIPQMYCRGTFFDKSTYSFNTQYHFVSTDVWTSQWTETTWSQMGIQLSSVNCMFLQSCQAFDWPSGGAIDLPSGASIFLVTAFSGISTNPGTYGIQVRATCNILYNTLNAYTTGASGQILCIGIGSFLWTDKPIYWAQAKGTDTLVAGTKTIIYKNIPADAKIFVTRNTPGGVVGNLSVPQATRTGLGTTASQFIVNSDNVGDTSTFDWAFFSPSNATGGMFAH